MSTNYLESMLESVEPPQKRRLLLTYLQHQIADLLGLPITQLDPAVSLSNYGISSLQAVELSQRVEKDIDRELPATLAYDYPTINSLCDYLLEDVLGLKDKAVSETAVTKADFLSEIEEMSESDAELALLQELQRSKDQ